MQHSIKSAARRALYLTYRGVGGIPLVKRLAGWIVGWVPALRGRLIRALDNEIATRNRPPPLASARLPEPEAAELSLDEILARVEREVGAERRI